MYDVFSAWASVSALLDQRHQCPTSAEASVELFNSHFAAVYGKAATERISVDDHEDVIQVKVNDRAIEQRNLDGRVTHTAEDFRSM